MASEASKYPSIIDAELELSMTSNTIAPISDAAGGLCDKMQELSTVWPPYSRSSTEIFGNTCGAINQESTEQSELSEYRGILETLKDMLWVDRALCDEIQQGPWGYQRDAPQKDGYSKEKALNGFLAKHKEFLPRGKDTRLYLLKEILLELQLEMRNEQTSADMKRYQEIKADLRALIGDHKVREFLERSGTMTDDDVLSFYKSHLQKWTNIPSSTLRRAGNAIQREVEDEAEMVNKAKLSKQKRAVTIHQFRRYQAMIKEGLSSKEAMAELDKEHQNQAFEKPLPMQYNQETEEIRKAWSYMPMPPIRSPSLESVSLEIENKLARETVDLANINRAGPVGTCAPIDKKELSMCCIQEVSSDEHSNSSDSLGENEPEVVSRGRAPGSPTKRRIVSGDRNPSPTKKGKTSPEKARIRGTRGIAQPVRKRY